MKIQEEIIKLENIKKKAVEEENYDLAKETNNKITQYKELMNVCQTLQTVAKWIFEGYMEPVSAFHYI